MTTRWDKNPEEELFALMRFVLRERADYIAVGESRGMEVRLVFQAAATGHGCITTFHASSLKELLARLKARPIMIDNSMLRLLDVIVILKSDFIDGSYRRYVDKVFIGNRLGKWYLVYKHGMEDEEFIKRISRVLRKEEVERIFERLNLITSNVQ